MGEDDDTMEVRCKQMKSMKEMNTGLGSGLPILSVWMSASAIQEYRNGENED